MPTPTIVQASGEHIDAAWHVVARCVADLAAHGIAQWDAIYPSRSNVENDIAAREMYVQVDGGTVHTVVTLNAHQDPEYACVSWTSGTPALVVHRLCVDPGSQGRGYARAMMDFAEAHAAANGYASVRLDAYSPNARSVSLYRRRGYREAGRVRFPRREEFFYCFELDVTHA